MRTLILPLVFGFSCLLLTACGPAPVTDNMASSTVSAEDVAGSYGDNFDASKVLPADMLIRSYQREQLLDTVTTTLQGTVNSVCQAKGCWMTIAAGEDKEMMVKFKDYGFFMPKDISGREVVMHGMAFYRITPVDELRHYAQDAGKSPEEIAAITEPKNELHFLAEGVQLLSAD